MMNWRQEHNNGRMSARFNMTRVGIWVSSSVVVVAETPQIPPRIFHLLMAVQPKLNIFIVIHSPPPTTATSEQ